jgi:hypothetical protein
METIMPNALALAAVAVLGLGVPQTLAAQDTAAAPLPAPGTRVRVTAPALRRPITGTLLDVSADSLRLRRDIHGDTVSVATASLSALEVSAGRRTHRLRDSGIGFLAGAGIGAVVGLATYRKSDCSASCLDFGPGFDAVAGGIVFGAAGVVIGFLTGTFPKEVWVPASSASPQRLRVGIQPAHDGVHRLALRASMGI